MTFEDAEEKITKAFGGYMAPKERQAMEIGWELSRAEALKEAAEIARKIGEESGPQNERAVTARRIAKEIEAKMK